MDVPGSNIVLPAKNRAPAPLCWALFCSREPNSLPPRPVARLLPPQVKKAWHGWCRSWNSTSSSHTSMSEVVPLPGSWVRACHPSLPSLYLSRMLHVRRLPSLAGDDDGRHHHHDRLARGVDSEGDEAHPLPPPTYRCSSIHLLSPPVAAPFRPSAVARTPASSRVSSKR